MTSVRSGSANRPIRVATISPDSIQSYRQIQADIVRLLETARRAVARSINAAMTATYWEIGRRIVEFEQEGAERAAYGDALVQRLAEDLTQRFGRGYSRQNLSQMRAFYRAWPAKAICQTLSGKSSLVPIPDALAIHPGVMNCQLLGETDILSALAKAFPLPWSAYVRLLAVRNELARQYARQHWAKPGENRPVGLIICATKGVAEAHYALDGLPNKVLAAEYRTVLPDEKLLAKELVRTRRQTLSRPLRGDVA
jgi:hypothetical protein